MSQSGKLFRKKWAAWPRYCELLSKQKIDRKNFSPFQQEGCQLSTEAFLLLATAANYDVWPWKSPVSKGAKRINWKTESWTLLRLCWMWISGKRPKQRAELQALRGPAVRCDRNTVFSATLQRNEASQQREIRRRLKRKCQECSSVRQELLLILVVDLIFKLPADYKRTPYFKWASAAAAGNVTRRSGGFCLFVFLEKRYINPIYYNYYIYLFSKGAWSSALLLAGHADLPAANEALCSALCRLTRSINKQIFCRNSGWALFLEAAAAAAFNSLRLH